MFGITASTPRRISPVIYELNMDALTSIAEHANANNVRVLFYIVPLRNDVESPYIYEEYSEFKRRIMKSFIDYKNVEVINLENIVPASAWGKKDSTNMSGDLEIDFMHFTEEGHKLLTDELFTHIMS